MPRQINEATFIFAILLQLINLNNGQVVVGNPFVLHFQKPQPPPPPPPNTNTIENLLAGSSGIYKATEAEFPGFDGWYNNLATPDLGAIDRPLLRRWPASYQDGVYEPAGHDRPNPLTLSEELLKGEIGTQTKTGKNALVVFFGQQVVEEILDAQRPACPPEYFNIPIPMNHTYRETPGHTELPFLRTRFDQRTGYSPGNPRQQLNEITPYLDGGLMYGTTKQWSDQLRINENGVLDPDGLLASSHDGLFPAYNTDRLPLANPPPPYHHAEMALGHQLKPVSRFFKLGNPRGNENTFLLTFGVLWFRWHNVLAKQIRVYQPNWSSERVFNEARKWVIATQQHIVVDEWLPAWTNRNLAKYLGYDPTVNPQIDQMFQGAAFRFGHTLVPPAVYMRDYSRLGCNHQLSQLGTNTVRTCNSFWRPQDALLTKYNATSVLDIDRMLMGLAHQLCEMDDHKIVEDLRGNVFGPLEFPRRDLMALNIQRGRDHGIPDFNAARKAFGLKEIRSFEHFGHASSEIRSKAAELYENNVDDIDLWIGGILETNENGPGELFSEIILDQFNRIRNADRFWFENTNNALFTSDEVARIKALTMRSIILSVTKLGDEDLPAKVFFVGSTIPPNCSQFVQSNCSAAHFPNKICYHLPQPNQALINETCVQGYSYDYFSNSELSFILSFVALSTFIVGLGTFIYFKLKLIKQTPPKGMDMMNESASSFSVMAKEWQGKYILKHNIILKFDHEEKVLAILELDGQCRRRIQCINGKIKKIHNPPDKPHFMIIMQQEYDLVVEFPTFYIRNSFQVAFFKFLNDVRYPQTDYVNDTSTNVSDIMNKVVSKEDRQKILEDFVRIVFAQAFKIDLDINQLLKDGLTAKQIAQTELTLLEFAETLNLSPTHSFVTKMFKLIDKDRNGLVSYREFVDMLIIFANGDEIKKAELLFKMYDVNATGELAIEDFEDMIRSFLEMVNGNIVRADLQNTIIDMINKAGLSHKKVLDFNDFQKLVGYEFAKLKDAHLGINHPIANNPISSARHTIEAIYATNAELQARIVGNVNTNEDGDSEHFNKMIVHDSKEEHSMSSSTKTSLLESVEKHSKKIFWFGLYTLVMWAIFAERAYHYSIESEHTGLRRIAGYGVTITRGAASAMMFTYSSLLVTVCKNFSTFARETILNQYFPFDSYIEFHKYIAYWALFFTVLHVIGHGFNFYHIATQTSDDLACLFPNYFHSTHEIPKFHYWCWQTMTGFTGVVLTLITVTMFMFAQQIVRRRLYDYFWYSHTLYVPFYIFMVLHGTGRLIQEPFFHYFFLGPVILFAIDKTFVLSRNKVLIPVINAELLPSDVTKLIFKRPQNFGYKAGQYVRIACVALNSNDYHPFTLTSSPNEVNLTAHIRSVGPWTRNIRKIYNSLELSKIYLDGPYGEEHQHWYEYDVSIFVGSGIGVTPFASILKDIVFRASIEPHIRSKKVYFFWVSRTQRQFEWLMEILKDIEEKDVHNIITTHIFITQFYEKFDIRMTLLYICERHYQRLANKSLFTNLRAITHFGRPKFAAFFKSIKGIHADMKQIGVFSCGSSNVTSSIEMACSRINKNSAGPNMNHHYQNF